MWVFFCNACKTHPCAGSEKKVSLNEHVFTNFCLKIKKNFGHKIKISIVSESRLDLPWPKIQNLQIQNQYQGDFPEIDLNLWSTSSLCIASFAKITKWIANVLPELRVSSNFYLCKSKPANPSCFIISYPSG